MSVDSCPSSVERGRNDKWFKQIAHKLKVQIIALNELADIFENVSGRRRRHDQADYLCMLKVKIIEEVESVQRMETASHSGHSKAALIAGLSAFGLGSLLASMSGRKDPGIFGLKLAGSVLSEKSPFGTVLIAVGTEGIPEGLKVIPISSLARDSKTSESDIKVTLQNSGYLLMTPNMFTVVLDKVESKILNGSISLPLDMSMAALD